MLLATLTATMAAIRYLALSLLLAVVSVLAIAEFQQAVLAVPVVVAKGIIPPEAVPVIRRPFLHHKVTTVVVVVAALVVAVAVAVALRLLEALDQQRVVTVAPALLHLFPAQLLLMPEAVVAVT